MRRILSFLGVTPAVSAPGHRDSDAIRRIATQIDQLDPDRAIYVAAFAYVLSRIAQADHEVTAAETGTMERLVRALGCSKKSAGNAAFISRSCVEKRWGGWG